MALNSSNSSNLDQLVLKGLMNSSDVKAQQQSGATLDPMFRGFVTRLQINGYNERRSLAGTSTSRVVVGRTRIDT